MAKKADINIENFNLTINVDNFDSDFDDDEGLEEILPFIRKMEEPSKDILLLPRGKLLYTWTTLDELKEQLAELGVGDILALMEVDERGEQNLTGPIMHFVVADKVRSPNSAACELIFVAENVLFEHRMDKNGAACEKFEDTELFEYLNTEFKAKLNRDVCKLLVGDIYIPSAGQVFGRSDEWANEHYIMDDHEQWQYMKTRKNRIAVDKDDDICWWWLSNKVKPEYSATTFAVVVDDGIAISGNASASRGVRPAFSVRVDI